MDLLVYPFYPPYDHLLVPDPKPQLSFPPLPHHLYRCITNPFPSAPFHTQIPPNFVALPPPRIRTRSPCIILSSLSFNKFLAFRPSRFSLIVFPLLFHLSCPLLTFGHLVFFLFCYPHECFVSQLICTCRWSEWELQSMKKRRVN